MNTKSNLVVGQCFRTFAKASFVADEIALHVERIDDNNVFYITKTKTTTYKDYCSHSVFEQWLANKHSGNFTVEQCSKQAFDYFGDAYELLYQSFMGGGVD